MSTLAVLVPSPSGYALFLRRPPAPLRKAAEMADPRLLRVWLNTLPSPLRVVAVDGKRIGWVQHTLPDGADLVLVPPTWLRHIPHRHMALRARLAARLAHDHAQAPIETWLHPDPWEIPF